MATDWLSDGSYRTILDATSDAICVHDLVTFEILDVNRAMCELHGLSAAEIRARGMLGLSGPRPEYSAEMAAGYIARAASGEAVRFEWTTCTVDGEEIVWDVQLRRATLQGHEVLISVARDIRVQKRSDDALRHANERLEQRVEERTRALAEANDALRTRDALFRRITDNMYDVIGIIDAEGRYTYVSPSVQSVLGYAPAELIGDRSLLRVHPDDTDEARARMQETLASPGRPVRFEHRFRHRDGRWRWVEGHGITFGEGGSVEGLIVTSRDVTDRHEAEQALRESERRFRLIAESLHGFVGVVDAEARYTYLTPSVERVLGFAPGELIGTSGIDLVHPDDVPQAYATLERALAHPGESIRFRHRFRHRDGSWLWVEDVGITVAPGTLDQGIITHTRDISAELAAEQALRESEERFRAMIENAHDAIVIVDADGTTRYQSPSMERLVGYSPDEMAGRSALTLVHPDDAPGVAETLTAITRYPGSTGAIDYRFRHRDGRWRRLEAFGRTLEPVSASAGVVINIRDVTERWEAEEALRQAKAEAERANHAKSEFLSRMSHELRTPLNSILGFAQILERIELEPRDRRAVQHILTAGEHLLNLINEVLDIARIEAGRHALSIEPVELKPVLSEAVALVRPLAAAQGVRLAEAAVPGGTAFVRADRQRLVQVLLNLLSNAVKYNHAGGSVMLSVTCDDAADRLRVRVEDTGRGIPADRQAELFTPFARLGSETSGVEGTGLGLALSQRLAEAMGGELRLESSASDGSTFLLELERAPAPAAVAGLSVVSAPVEGPAVRTAKLLYVEDNLANLSLVEQLLSFRPGWTLIPALQGQLGIELAREHDPDVVLLDLHLPDIPGEEVFRQLRADPRTAAMPVIVISADATGRSIERLKTAGVDGYLTKPLRIDDFLAAVDAALPARGSE